MVRTGAAAIAEHVREPTSARRDNARRVRPIVKTRLVVTMGVGVRAEAVSPATHVMAWVNAFLMALMWATVAPRKTKARAVPAPRFRIVCARRMRFAVMTHGMPPVSSTLKRSDVAYVQTDACRSVRRRPVETMDAVAPAGTAVSDFGVMRRANAMNVSPSVKGRPADQTHVAGRVGTAVETRPVRTRAPVRPIVYRNAMIRNAAATDAEDYVESVETISPAQRVYAFRPVRA